MLSVQQKAERFISNLPQARLLKLTVLSADEQQLKVLLPYQDAIVGNPFTGVLHGGALTTLMDTTCGTAVFAFLPGFELCPTLDLRADYIKAAEPQRGLVANARIVRISHNVIFTECRVYQENDTEIIASCTANFMRIGAEFTPERFRQAIESGQPMEVEL